MSYVSNFMIISPVEDNAEEIARLNEAHGYDFKRVDGSAGGKKAIEWDVYMCAMNYRTAEELVAHILEVRWSRPFQLLAAEQDDDEWRFVPLPGLKMKRPL